MKEAFQRCTPLWYVNWVGAAFYTSLERYFLDMTDRVEGFHLISGCWLMEDHLMDTFLYKMPL